MSINFKKALIIASHPDDDILGCGGLISKFKEHVEFKVIFIAEGSTCRFDDCDDPEAKKEVSKRNGFAISALNFLGVSNYFFYNLPCGKLDQIPQLTINKIIEKEIKDFKPDAVFTHSNSDSNKDHHKVYDSTIIATRPGCGVDFVFSYEVLSSTEWGFGKTFSPNVFFSLNKNNLKDKWKALQFYESEIKEYPYPRSEEGINTLAKYRGLQSGNAYAEAFTLVRGII